MGDTRSSSEAVALQSTRTPIDDLMVAVGAAVALERKLPLPKDIDMHLAVAVDGVHRHFEDRGWELIASESLEFSLFGAASCLVEHPDNHLALKALRAAWELARFLRLPDAPEPSPQPKRWEEKAGIMG